MGQGSIIGYDLSEEGCQISYYNEAQHEPETVKNESGEYQIPLVIGCKNDAWYIGEEARSHAKHKMGRWRQICLPKVCTELRSIWGEELTMQCGFLQNLSV